MTNDMQRVMAWSGIFTMAVGAVALVAIVMLLIDPRTRHGTAIFLGIGGALLAGLFMFRQVRETTSASSASVVVPNPPGYPAGQSRYRIRIRAATEVYRSEHIFDFRHRIYCCSHFCSQISLSRSYSPPCRQRSSSPRGCGRNPISLTCWHENELRSTAKSRCRGNESPSHGDRTTAYCTARNNSAEC